MRYLRSVQMTKTNLIDHVAEATKGTKKETEQLIDAVLASITEALVKGEKVDLRGFGSFQVSGKKERQGRNPRTGETIQSLPGTWRCSSRARNYPVASMELLRTKLAPALQPTRSLNRAKVLRKYTATKSTSSETRRGPAIYPGPLC